MISKIHHPFALIFGKKKIEYQYLIQYIAYYLAANKYLFFIDAKINLAYVLKKR
jgi:hypothetical protein